jgi:adenylate cyclase
VAETILGSPAGLRLGGDRREITLLVADLRGFSALAARLPAEDVIRCLNGYLGRVVEVLARHRATIDEFQGDGILAFFGAPLAAPDDPERAVACAIDMQRALAGFNEEQRRRGLAELAMGVGIHSGEVIVGNIGSERRTKYGAVGEAVNLAFRIESQTVGGQVLIGPRTYERVRDVVEVGGTLEVRLKGVEDAVRLYDVQAIAGPHATRLPAAAVQALVPLDSPLSVVCHPVEGTRVVEAGIPGRLVRASADTLELRVERALERRGTVLVLVEAAADGADRAIYGKVTSSEPMEDGTIIVLVALTSVPPRMRRLLRERLAASV